MNINIINKCNNSCTFCFQNKNRATKLMTTNDVAKVLKWANLKKGSTIGIIGGEPTLNPYLKDICRYIVDGGYIVNVFTNLLCDTNVIEGLLKIRNVNILINTVHPKEKRDRFLENYKLITERNIQGLWSLDSAIFIGATFDGTNDCENIDFLKKLVELDTKSIVKGIRVSHAIPSPGKKYGMNASFGESINELIDTIHRIAPRMLYVFDCAINMCLMSPELYNKFLLNPKIVGLSTECQNPVFDIGVDFSTSWCACFDDHPRLKIKNIFEYRNIQHMYNDMYRIMFEESKSLKGECDSRNCGKTYCSGMCQGVLYRMQKE